MTDAPRDSGKTSGVDDIRAELGDELMRAARANPKPRSHRSVSRRSVIWVAAALVAAVPASFAVAEFIPDDEAFVPAPAPLFAPGGEYGECPDDVVRSLLRLERISDYPETPGYPVEGCPTLEQLLENEPAAAALERRLGDNTSHRSLREK
jgi:hypothetical protein